MGNEKMTFYLDEAGPGDLSEIKKGLEEYNRRFAPEDGHRSLAFAVREKGGELAGGLTGGTYWNWLYIQYLWVDERFRGAGIGSVLLEKAEAIARERGCCFVHLDTHDYQARGFYEKRGYSVRGELRDLPPGHVRFLMAKEL